MNIDYKNNLVNFLINNRWEKISENDRFDKFKAPDEWQIDKEYIISVANNDNFDGYEQYLKNITKILSDIYLVNFDDLENLFNCDNTILKLKINDEDVVNGKIQFNKFEQLIEKFKKILLNTAAFEISKEVLLDFIPKEAEKYLNLCKFLSTEKGSFIAKIELPKNDIIYEEPLFSENNISALEINNKLFNVFDIVVNDVFPNTEFTDSFIDNRKDFINYNLFTEIANFYSDAAIENISFEFLNITKDKIKETIVSKGITKEKIQNLNTFNKLIKDKIFKEKDVYFTGYILELKSKDPETNNNTIKVIGIIDNVDTIVSITLPSERYKNAVDAHKTKKKIKIKGRVKEEITQKKMIRLDSFIIIE